ncbi:MAG TPA: ATP-binding protein, partial [Duganella sp.]
GEHLLTLINDILELSKIEAGRAVLQTEVIRIDEILQEVMDMVSMRADQGGVELELDSAGVPSGARVDGTKLRQVLLNLMSNAVKFTGQGKVTLRVRGVPRQIDAAPGCELAFAVVDDGPGISPIDQTRIFEPFVQADGPDAKEGTGLGLAISREFVQLMGGVLSVQSVRGAGATFQFTIRVPVADGAPAAAGRPAAALEAPQRGRRVLVAIGDADGGARLEGLLKPLGFEVAVVGDGVQALAMVDVWQPDLVFMDWRMPGMDGGGAIGRIRAREHGVQPRIVMLGAPAAARAGHDNGDEHDNRDERDERDEREEREAALRAGADDYARKPVGGEWLRALLERQPGLNFARRQPGARQPAPAPLSGADLARLDPALRGQLKVALQQLNLARVALLLEPLPAPLAGVVERIEHMVRLHQYPQLCALLDQADSELEA